MTTKAHRQLLREIDELNSLLRGTSLEDFGKTIKQTAMSGVAEADIRGRAEYQRYLDEHPERKATAPVWMSLSDDAKTKWIRRALARTDGM